MFPYVYIYYWLLNGLGEENYSVLAHDDILNCTTQVEFLNALIIYFLIHTVHHQVTEEEPETTGGKSLLTDHQVI